MKRHHFTLIPFYYTDNRSKHINFNYENILKTIQSLDSNKVHGDDGPSVKMLKLSCHSIIKPLLIIFRNCLKFGTSPDGWKKSNVVLVINKLSISTALSTCYCMLQRSWKTYFCCCVWANDRKKTSK